MAIIFENQEAKSKAESFLSKELPMYREAFSHRTCFLMACLSELVYLRFNEPILNEKQKKFLTKKVEKLLDKENLSSLEKLFELLAYDHEEEKAKLIEELKQLNIEIIDYYDKGTTQAIMVSSNEFYALSFRGTETNISDIRTDLKANKTVCNTGGNVHKGFNEAYELVEKKIQCFIDKNLKDKPLLITGHSLGGALATIATKRLKYEKIAACYTFGSPRVGDEEWMLGIKSPVYRIVNSADPVTMLPPGTEVIDSLSYLFKFVPYFGASVSKYLESNFSGYTHAGYMRYLTNIENGEFHKAQLVYSVSIFRRLRAYIFKKASFWDLPSDHSISVYRKKMQEIAYKRQDMK